jgi:NAD+ diphosphatase
LHTIIVDVTSDLDAAGYKPLVNAPPDHAGRSRFVHVVGSAVWIDEHPGDAAWGVHFVGLVDGEAWWCVDVPPGVDPSDGGSVDLRAFHGIAPEHHWLAAGRAVQVVEWARTHRFCGRCGQATEPVSGERAMRCPECQLLSFPRLSPAMITLVTKGPAGPDQMALLARGVQWTGPMFSCLAGFVEPGESLEAAVIREVREEVGIEVSRPRYFGSQPWPFPNSLMVGFRADHVSGEIECDPTEIAEAGWFRRHELPMVPPPISIARSLIDAWLAELVPEPVEDDLSAHPAVNG